MKKVIFILIFTLLVGSGLVFAAPQESVNYTVVQGDTLWGIAQKIESTVVDLLDLNPQITPDNLRVGQELSVPVEPIWSYHVVQQGDNVNSLAIQYRVPLDALLEANDIQNNRLTVGETIRIPIHFYIPPEEQGAGEQTIYVVEAGDTLLTIAKENKVSLKELMVWNDLENAHTILAGQKLVISK